MNKVARAERPWRPSLPSILLLGFLLMRPASPVSAAVLFEDDFNRGFPGWTAVQPQGVYLDGPLLWQHDIVAGAFVEQSNIYTDNATFSPTAIAPMLINDTLTALNFTYNARLTAGDDDGFGLIFGYQNETNFYRVSFARQSRPGGFPWTGWNVDRMVDGAVTNLFGAGTPGHVPTFVNQANRPFDVTITVDVLNRLTLTVVDNPTGSSTTYNLVTNQFLPSGANGKVGIFTWGMSGGTPRGFRIQNLNLSPVALSGNPSGLTNWTAVVPPRSNGSSAVSGTPIWSLGVGKDGPLGYLVENSDALAGNDAAGQIDFTGPTVVAGDTNWTNYVMSARITPRDDDGHGILLRYRNLTNFYRVALRSQVSGIGIPPGLSVQKNVNGVYSEVYRDSPVQYNPAPNVTYDLVASINGNALQILLVSDPEGVAQAYAYGPFNITGGTVNQGGIGLFSWAMSQTEFDNVNVQDGTPLYVSSPYGTPNPPKGLNGIAPGTMVNASAGDPVVDVPGIRRFPAGWSGSGSVPSSGSGSNVTFTLNTFSHIHWNWFTEYQLTVTNETGGSVTYPPGDWFAEGTNIIITAVPDTGFAFGGWQGDVLSTDPTLNLTMNQPYSIVATFTADLDEDGMPDEWETLYFGNTSANPDDDADGDGRTNLEEYENGTNPIVADIFRIASLTLTNNQGVLGITNNTGTRFSIQRSTAPAGGWTTIATTQTVSTYTSSLPSSTQGYWRLTQPARPPEALPFVPGSWTLAVLPDTQVYSQTHPDLFKDQTRWIAENKDRYNIKYVLHLGDIVNNNNDVQWARAKEAIEMLDGVVPYALAPGNHDFGPNGSASDRTTLFNNYFPASNYVAWPTFGGTMEPDKMENTWHTFNAGGADWLILALEWGPRNTPVAWANQIVSNHPNHRVILITHAYMYFDETRYDWATKGSAQSWNPHSYGTASDPDGTNDGEELWNKLVKLHPNFTMTFNGHVLGDGLGRISTTNNAGNRVHQMLVNYQMHPLGGEGFLRLVEFLPDGETVQIKAYSPFYGTYKTDPQNQFILKLQPPLP